MGALGFETFLGLLTFTGSIMAFGKLQGFITGAPITWKGQNVANIGLFFGSLGGHRHRGRPPGADTVVFFVHRARSASRWASWRSSPSAAPTCPS